MAKRRRKRKKNLSTGAWVAIGLGIGIGIPAVVAGVVAIYGMKKATKFAEEHIDQPFPPDRPIPPIPTP